jgi:hypothetical protein
MAWRGEVRIEPQLGGRHGGFWRLGDAVVPRRVVYSHTSEGGEPDLKMYFEVRDDRPECTGIVFTTKPGGRGLRTADLQVLNLDAITRNVFTQVAAVRHHTNPFDGTPVPDNTVLFHPPRDEEEFRRLERDIYEARAARRGAVSQAELEEVAQVYREHVASSPTRMVAMLCGYSERTAARRVQQARAAGLLPKTTPGKRKA